MAVKCNNICKCYLKFHRYFEKQIGLPNNEYISDFKCERTGIDAKCKISLSLTTLHWAMCIDMCTIAKIIVIYQRKQICQANKGCIGDHGHDSANMAAHVQYLIIIQYFMGICNKKYDCQTRILE